MYSSEVQCTRTLSGRCAQVAYVENLGGSELFDSLYADDVEGHKINQMPGVKDLLDAYREKVNSIAQQIFEFGLQEHVKHELEKKAFWECVNEAKRANESLASKAIEEFNSTKTKVRLPMYSHLYSVL